MEGGGEEREREREREEEKSSEAHFRRSPVIDRLKFQTTDCSNPHQDFGPIEAQFWSSRVPFFYDTVNKPAIVFPPNASLSSAQNRRVDKKKTYIRPQGHNVSAEVSCQVLCTDKARCALQALIADLKVNA